MTYQPPKKSRTNLVAGLAIAALLVVGAVVAIVVTSSGDDSTAAVPGPAAADAAETRAAAARDAALADGCTAVEVFNTLDYRTADEDLDRWESMATGDLLTELRENHDRSRTRIEQARSATTATVLDAALAEFDEAAGTARLLAAVSVKVTVDGQAPTEKRTRVTVSLERDGDGWKASALSIA